MILMQMVKYGGTLGLFGRRQNYIGLKKGIRTTVANIWKMFFEMINFLGLLLSEKLFEKT